MAYDYNLAPKALSEQCAAFKKKYPTLDDLPADEYIMMPKYDGCLAIINTNAPVPMAVTTRTGELVHSMWHVAEQAKQIMPGYVIFGEAYKYDTPFKDISGEFRRHSQKHGLLAVAFDAVPVDDWRAGKCDKPYIERYAALKGAWLRTRPDSLIVAPALDLGAPQDFANMMVSRGGYDGAIIRRKDAPWTTGASKNGEAIKVKPVQSLDLRAVDWFYGKGKHAGRAGGIVVEYRGVRTQVGTGFSDEERERIAACPVGMCTIAEIEFMELTSDGKLREPRFKGWRYDKNQPDQ